jgi:hypothetical protein
VRETLYNSLLLGPEKKKTVGGLVIQNSNGYIPEFGTSEKNLGTSDL